MSKIVDAEAMYTAGLMHYHALFTDQNYIKAFDWWIKAAELGHCKAQHSLGVMYYHAQGVKKNYTKAVQWWTKSAEQGYPNAQNDLGLMHFKGTGVPVSYVKAYAWISVSKANGYNEAGEMIVSILKILTTKQKTKGQNMVEEISERIKANKN